MESVFHTYSPRKSQKKLGLVLPIRTNLSLCIIFSVLALLNLRLHRRVQLLVLASSPLEFRVLFTSCHAAAAPSSSPLPYTTIVITAAIYHHRHRRYHIPHIHRHHANPSPPPSQIHHQPVFHRPENFRHQSEFPPDSSPPRVLVRVQ